MDNTHPAPRLWLRRRTLTIALSALVLGGCADKEASVAGEEPMLAASSSPHAPPPQSDTSFAEGDAQRGLAEAEAAPVQRKLIQNAELHVRVESYAKARTHIEASLRELGGFIENARVEHADGQVSHAELTVRIPSTHMTDFLAGTAGHGDVLHESVAAEDVTERYFDLQARMKNHKRMETRLLALLDDKGDSVTSLLEVERELARVRGEIESYEGKLRLWDQQVAMSTVKLRLVSERVHAATTPPTLGDELGSTLKSSFATLERAGVALLVLLVALAPWLLPLLLLSIALRTVARRVLRRRARGALSPYAPAPAREGEPPIAA